MNLTDVYRRASAISAKAEARDWRYGIARFERTGRTAVIRTRFAGTRSECEMLTADGTFAAVNGIYEPFTFTAISVFAEHFNDYDAGLAAAYRDVLASDARRLSR